MTNQSYAQVTVAYKTVESLILHGYLATIPTQIGYVATIATQKGYAATLRDPNKEV